MSATGAAAIERARSALAARSRNNGSKSRARCSSSASVAYAFDSWVQRHLPSVRFCRYADDGVIRCRCLAQAKFVLAKIDERFRQCVLELHPEKTRIVYCKDVNRAGD
jgi:RNA-directed DNA polymerase